MIITQKDNPIPLKPPLSGEVGYLLSFFLACIGQKLTFITRKKGDLNRNG